MAFHNIWVSGDPRLSGYLRIASRERAKAHREVWGALVRAPAGLVRRLLEALRRHMRFRRSYRALSDLSDRELRDIGLSQGEIYAVSRRWAAEASATGLMVRSLRQGPARGARPVRLRMVHGGFRPTRVPQDVDWRSAA